jgi:hypothetical protein
MRATGTVATAGTTATALSARGTGARATSAGRREVVDLRRDRRGREAGA